MFPDGGRFWKICQTHAVSIFYTAPTAIRALMKLGDAIPATYDLSKLRGADIFFSGHLHVSHIAHTAERYKLPDGRNALAIQAGTATSTRARGEANSFNVVEFEHPNLTVKRFECETGEKGFAEAQSEQFTHGEKGWQPNG